MWPFLQSTTVSKTLLPTLQKKSKFIGHRNLSFEHTTGIFNSKSFIIQGKEYLNSLKMLKLVWHASDSQKNLTSKDWFNMDYNCINNLCVGMALCRAASVTFSSSKDSWVSVCCTLSCVQLFATPGTLAHQAPLPVEFFRQEYWGELPFPSPGESSEPRDQTQVSHTAGRFFTVWATREAHRLTAFIDYYPVWSSSVYEQARLTSVNRSFKGWNSTWT